MTIKEKNNITSIILSEYDFLKMVDLELFGSLREKLMRKSIVYHLRMISAKNNRNAKITMNENLVEKHVTYIFSYEIIKLKDVEIVTIE